MIDLKNTYKVDQIHLWHLFWTVLVAQLQEAITRKLLLWFLLITTFRKEKLPIYRPRYILVPIYWVFKPHPGTWSPSKLSLKFLYRKLKQNSTITSPILKIWHWNSTSWLIWLRWTSISKIRIFQEWKNDLLSSKPQ